MRDEPGRSTSTAVGAEAGRVSGRIAEEHRHLRELLGRVRHTRELQPLLRLLGEVRADLVEHFATEEASGGIRDVIDAEAPHLLERVDHLFDEHRLCLEEIDRISERIRRLLDGPVTELLRDADRLVETLHRHEAAETELLSGALYDEIGGGD